MEHFNAVINSVGANFYFLNILHFVKNAYKFLNENGKNLICEKLLRIIFFLNNLHKIKNSHFSYILKIS